jgi:hypothetical protein
MDPKVVPDKIINERFSKFVTADAPRGSKNLRSLMDLSEFGDKTPSSIILANRKS